MKRRREVKDVVIALKVDGSLVTLLDDEARREGLSRSAVIRRRLLRSFNYPHQETSRPVPALKE